MFERGFGRGQVAVGDIYQQGGAQNAFGREHLPPLEVVFVHACQIDGHAVAGQGDFPFGFVALQATNTAVQAMRLNLDPIPDPQRATE